MATTRTEIFSWHSPTNVNKETDINIYKELSSLVWHIPELAQSVGAVEFTDCISAEG